VREGEAPRAEAEAGERGWSGGWTGPDDEEPAGDRDRAETPQSGNGTDTEPKQTAEEIAFGSGGGRDESRPDGPGEGEEGQQDPTGVAESREASDTDRRAGGGDDVGSSTDVWDTVDAEGDDQPGERVDAGDGSAESAGDEEADGTGSSQGEAGGSDTEPDSADGSGSDPLADR